MVDDLDDICSSIHGLLSSTKRGLKYNDIVERLQDKGLVMATFKHPIQFTAVPIDKALEILSNAKNKYYARIR